jgi:hypothetical protein
VVVTNPDGPWVLASDIGPLRANFVRRKPTGLSSDPERARAALVTILEWVGDDVSRVIPGHEPALFSPGGSLELTATPATGRSSAPPGETDRGAQARVEGQATDHADDGAERGQQGRAGQ